MGTFIFWHPPPPRQCLVPRSYEHILKCSAENGERMIQSAFIFGSETLPQNVIELTNSSHKSKITFENIKDVLILNLQYLQNNFDVSSHLALTCLSENPK